MTQSSRIGRCLFLLYRSPPRRVITSRELLTAVVEVAESDVELPELAGWFVTPMVMFDRSAGPKMIVLCTINHLAIRLHPLLLRSRCCSMKNA
jgi:hypothetical protein